MNQYHYNATYQVKYHEIITKLSQYIHEYLPETDIIHLIKHQNFTYYPNLKGFTKQYGKAFRRYYMDSNGNWIESPKMDWVSGYNVTDDTLKAFALEIYHEYWNKE